jgi:hypothetical protein
MNGFNDRVSSNRFNSSALVSVTKSYNNMLDNFRDDYKDYEEHLSATLSINCSNQPVAFYDSVALSRTDRNRVHQDIIKLNQYLDQYNLAVNQFEADYLLATNGVSL